MTAPASIRDPGPRLLGRGQILGTFPEVAAFSCAFADAGACRLVSAATPEGLDGASLASAGRAIDILVKAIHARIDVDTWLWGYGRGPDSLVMLSHALQRWPGLPAAFEGADEVEAIALLALLMTGSLGKEAGRMLSRRGRLLLGVGEGGVSTPLALRCGPKGTAGRVEGFRAHGGPDLPFWIADRTLGVRFTVDRDAVTFRAHHPSIQEEMVQRCRRSGIDVA